MFRVIVAAWLTAVLFPLAALGQAQSKDEQKCTYGMNKSMEKVSKILGKNISRCLRDHANGELVGPVAQCIAADRRGKVAKMKAKTHRIFDRYCFNLPPYGVTDPDSVNTAATAKELALVTDVFGSELDGVLLQASQNKLAAKCQLNVFKALLLCQDAKLKRFNLCKRAGLKNHTIQSGADLESCLGNDPKGKIAKACNASPKPDKIRKALMNCSKRQVELGPLFPPCGSNDVEVVHACLEPRVECRVCLAINAADGLNRNCDEFDDGSLNGSCGDGCADLGGVDLGPCAMILGWGVVNGQCQLLSGCSSPVPLSPTRGECVAACSPECEDLSGVDLGPCDLVLGWAIVNGQCQLVSGCSAGPYRIFETRDACRSVCPKCMSHADCPTTAACELGSCKECICPLVYAPVCGVDGQTYENPCFAACRDVAIAHAGVCP